MFEVYRRCAAVSALLIMCFFVGCSKPAPESTEGGPQPKRVARATAKTPDAEELLTGLMGRASKVTSYKMIMDDSGNKMEIYMKLGAGKPLSLKTGLGQPGKWTIVRMDKKVMYMLDENTKTAISMPMKDAQDPKEKMPKDVDYNDLIGKKPKVTSERLDGLDCWKIEVAGDAEGSSTIWVDKKYGLARQMLVNGKTMKMKYEMINSVPDSAFELPAGTQVRDMGDMLKGMPNMPNMPDMPKMPGR